MWFILSIIAFFLLAVAAVVDKYLLSKTKIVPVSFAFYISLLGGVLSSFFIFFEKGFYLPVGWLAVLLAGGCSLFFGLYYLFLAIARSEVSKSNPIVVSFIPIVVFALSWFLEIELVSVKRVAGALLIVAGSYLLSQVGLKKTHLDKKTWLFVIVSSLMLGASNVFGKIAYDNLSFITAFVWMRWFTVMAAVLFVALFNKWSKVLIRKKKKLFKKKKQPWAPFLLGQLAGSLGVILQQVAIKLGNVILVSALNGIQFFFIIFLVYLMSKFYPKVLKESIKKKFIFQKLLWSSVLFVGFVLILI